MLNELNEEVNKKIALVKIQKNEMHTRILYELLRKRKANISHKSLPTYLEHKAFVINHPYRIWNLVRFNNEFIGNFYILKNNCVGITISNNLEEIAPVLINHILSSYKPLKAIKSVRANEFDFNVSPDNLECRAIMEKMGAKLTQVTYNF